MNVMIQGTIDLYFQRLGEHLRRMICGALSSGAKGNGTYQSSEDGVTGFDRDLFASVVDDNVFVGNAS